MTDMKVKQRMGVGGSPLCQDGSSQLCLCCGNSYFSSRFAWV